MRIEMPDAETVVFDEVCFDARLVLIDSGQVFHWVENEKGITGTVSGKHISIEQRENGIVLHGCTEKDIPFWRRYLDLDRDYGELERVTEKIPLANRAVKLLPGLRVLHQPEWEALTAFIISANNNIKRIRSIIKNLNTSLGENGGFPTPQVLAEADVDLLRECGCGYRAPYLIETARAVTDGFDLSAVAAMDYDTAHKTLLTLKGVGDKVADCVQLFGMGHSRAFPVDVWVERLMKRWFMDEKASKADIRRKAYDMFGEQAGLVQQSLFHCARLGLISLEEEE